MKQHAYQDALDFLYQFIDYSRTHQQNIAPENFDLNRTRVLVEALGNPQQSYPSIHIAGTKGKGSVAVFCAAALQAGGFKTGLYTSPHLKDFTERIQINTEPISQDAFVTLVEEIKPFVAEIPDLTSYEIQTALAFWHFSRQEVDIAVVEVGLGGRLDSTNIITPLVSVITSISLDHTFVLGDTIPEIAAEKGGIIKPGVPVVSAPQVAEARQTLQEIAREQQSPFTLVGEEIRFQAGSHSLEGQTFTLWRQPLDGKPLEFRIKMLGEHQIENASTAYAALDAIRGQGIKLTDADVQRGFAQASWPGRFEVIKHQPPVVLDGAHNRYSAQILMETVHSYFPGKPITLVFGASEDKDISGMFAELLPHVQTLVVVQSNHPRATPIGELKEKASSFESRVLVVEDISQALPAALSQTEEYGLIVATGSLYTVGELRSAWLHILGEDGYNNCT